MNLREYSVCCWGEHILQLLPGMFCTCLWCPFGLACNLIPMFFCCICLLLLKEGHKSLQLLLCWRLSLQVSWYLLYIFTCICFIYWGLGIVLLNWSLCHYFVSSYWFRFKVYITLYVMEVWIFLFSSGLNLYGTSLWQNWTLYLRLTSDSQQPSQLLLLSVGIIDTSHNI